jgi:predicted dehydrogenase
VAVTSLETEEIARLADRTERRVAVGLQGRMRILYTTVHSAVAGFGRVIDESTLYLYLEDPATGMNLPTIVAGPALDLASR